MWRLTCTEKGMSLIEVVIALLLIGVGILGMLSLQPSAWRLSGRSDFLGRAGGILSSTMEDRRIFILNESNSNPCAANNPLVNTETVYASGLGEAGQTGDMAFTVTTTTTDQGNNTWQVTVQVTWTGNPNGISDTIRVGRHLSFLWPPL